MMDCGCNINKAEICPNCGSPSNYLYLGNRETFTDKLKEVTILPEILHFQLTDDAKIEITDLYQKVTKGKVKRNAPRRALIYCCILEICKTRGMIFNKGDFQQLLNIRQRDINTALKEMKESMGISNLNISIRDVLRYLMNNLNIKDSCLEDIMNIYEKCKRHSQLFNSSKTETLAAGLLYYYLDNNLEGFNRDGYFDISKVSKDTILLVNDDITKYINY